MGATLTQGSQGAYINLEQQEYADRIATAMQELHPDCKVEYTWKANGNIDTMTVYYLTYQDGMFTEKYAIITGKEFDEMISNRSNYSSFVESPLNKFNPDVDRMAVIEASAVNIERYTNQQVNDKINGLQFNNYVGPTFHTVQELSDECVTAVYRNIYLSRASLSDHAEIVVHNDRQNQQFIVYNGTIPLYTIPYPTGDRANLNAEYFFSGYNTDWMIDAQKKELILNSYRDYDSLLFNQNNFVKTTINGEDYYYLVFDGNRRKILLTSDEYKRIQNGDWSFLNDNVDYKEHIAEACLNEQYDASMEVEYGTNSDGEEGYYIWANGTLVGFIKSDEVDDVSQIGNILQEKIESGEIENNSEINRNRANKNIRRNDTCINFDDEKHYKNIVSNLKSFDECCKSAKNYFQNGIRRMMYYPSGVNLLRESSNVLTDILDDSSYLKGVITNIVRLYRVTDSELKDYYNLNIVSDLFKNAGLCYDAIGMDDNNSIKIDVKKDSDARKKIYGNGFDSKMFLNDFKSIVNKACSAIMADYDKYKEICNNRGLTLTEDDFWTLCNNAAKRTFKSRHMGVDFSNPDELEESYREEYENILKDISVNFFYECSILKGNEGFTRAWKNKSFEDWKQNVSESFAIIEDIIPISSMESVGEILGYGADNKLNYITECDSLANQFGYITEFSDSSNVRLIQDISTLQTYMPFYEVALSDMYDQRLEEVRNRPSNEKRLEHVPYQSGELSDAEIAMIELVNEADIVRNAYNNTTQDSSEVVGDINSYLEMFENQDISVFLKFAGEECYSDISLDNYNAIIREKAARRKGIAEANEMLRRLANGDQTVFAQVFGGTALTNLWDNTFGYIPSLLDPGMRLRGNVGEYRDSYLLEAIQSCMSDGDYAASSALEYSNGMLTEDEYTTIKKLVVAGLGQGTIDRINLDEKLGTYTGKLAAQFLLKKFVPSSVSTVTKSLNAGGKTAHKASSNGYDDWQARGLGLLKGVIYWCVLSGVSNVTKQWSKNISGNRETLETTRDALRERDISLYENQKLAGLAEAAQMQFQYSDDTLEMARRAAVSGVFDNAYRYGLTYLPGAALFDITGGALVNPAANLMADYNGITVTTDGQSMSIAQNTKAYSEGASTHKGGLGSPTKGGFWANVEYYGDTVLNKNLVSFLVNLSK